MVRGQNVCLFVSRLGLNLCLMNGICISRVPRGTNAEILMRHEANERVCAKVPQS